MTSDFDTLEILVKTYGRTDIKEHLLTFLHGLRPDIDTCPGGAGTAPTSKHHSESGGLIRHVCQMFNVAKHMNNLDGGELTSVGEILTVCVLHDIHKVRGVNGLYYENNILKNGMRSTAKPWKVNKEASVPPADTSPVMAIPYSDLSTNDRITKFMLSENKTPSSGQASLLVTCAIAPELFVRLTDSERFAIKYHDGLYGGNRSAIQSNEDALYIICHAADMLSARCDTRLCELGI